MDDSLHDRMQIGKVLRDARSRAGLEITTVEERTKIRLKYLRALESEDWDVLPSHAYAKGWLRTYASLLGLDAEALVDEYRRQVEDGGHAVAYPLSDQVPDRRHRAGGEPRRPRPGLLLAALVVAIVAVLAVIGLAGEDGDEGPDRDRAERRQQARAERRAKRRREERREERAAEAAERVELALEVRSPVVVCLLDADGKELIDGQVLAAGAVEGPWEGERFELRFPSGYDRSQFRLLLDGEVRNVPETSGPTAYEIIAPDRLRPAPTPGPTCP